MYYLSAIQLEKKLLGHFTEVTIGNDSITRGNLYLTKVIICL